MRYRLGRSHSDIVYRQLGDGPSDEDPRVAVFTEAVDAIAVVALLNGEEDDALWADDPIAAVSLPVAGSTPLDSPAARLVLDPSSALETLRYQLAAWRSAGQEGYDPGDLAEAAEALLAAPPTPQLADEPVPVPPPVDAFLDLALKRYRDICERRGDGGRVVVAEEALIDMRDKVLSEVARLHGEAWAAGVEEGRRRAEDEFDNWRTYQLAKLVYQYFHVDAGDNSDPVDVAISVLEEAIRDHGTEGGRRQETEERTEVEHG